MTVNTCLTNITRSWTTVFFISYQAHSNLQFTAVDTWPAMSGISFMLINVRVGLGWAQTGSQMRNDSLGSSNRHNGVEASSAGSIPMRPLTVKITSVVEQERDNKLKSVGDGFRTGSFDI